MAKNDTADTAEKKPRKAPVPRPVIVLMTLNAEAANDECPVNIVEASKDPAAMLEKFAALQEKGAKVWFQRVKTSS